MTVTRVDYAYGVYVTYEKMTPDSDGYDVGQRWYYAVWSSEIGDYSTGFEVEDSGYAETKGEAVEFARQTRQSIRNRRPIAAELVPVKVDPFVGAKVVDYDGSVLVIGEPVAEPYLGGYRVLRNTSGDVLDQSYHEDYLLTLPLAVAATSA